MNEAVKLDMFYPYPPERVWQVLTDRRALAAWMMENDFEPKLGHRFRFHSQPLPGLTTTIQCEVVELEAPTRLVYTWKESLAAEPSLVVWTLTPVVGGTQVRLNHHQQICIPAVAGSSHLGRHVGTIAHMNHQGYHHGNQRQVPRSVEYAGLTGLEMFSDLSPSSSRAQSHAAAIATLLDLPTPQFFAWDYLLNQRLPAVLAHHE